MTIAAGSEVLVRTINGGITVLTLAEAWVPGAPVVAAQLDWDGAAITIEGWRIFEIEEITADEALYGPGGKAHVMRQSYDEARALLVRATAALGKSHYLTAEIDGWLETHGPTS